MDHSTELKAVFLAIRDRLVDPARLAGEALDWSPESGPLLDHLAGRGVLTPDILRVLRDRETPARSPETLSDSTATHVRFDQGATVGSDTVATADYVADGPTVGGGPPTTAGHRYRPLQLHRTGGLGQVWLARDRVTGREVALKVLRPDRRGQPQVAARFVREALVTGRLEHPGVVPLYDAATEAAGDEPWYVMRFVAGKTLAEAAVDYHARRAAGRAGPLDLASLLDAFVTVCRTVAFAHSRGVLHRDLKGQNVVLGDYGEVFLLDWGLAKAAGSTDGTSVVTGGEGDPETTEMGVVVGTPAYMAPEVAAGQPATKSSDVFGLGAILYAILTGQAPFTGTTAAEVLAKAVVGNPLTVREVNPAVPPALAAVCEKAMSRLPADRYVSADELATDIRRWAADEPVSAYPDPLLTRVARRIHRHRTKAAAVAALLVTAAIALAVSTALIWREQRATAAARKKAEDEWHRAETERARAAENYAGVRTLAVDLAGRVSALETGRGARQVDAGRKAALDEVANGFERLRGTNPDDPALRRHVAALRRYTANAARWANDVPAAETSYKSAIRHYEDLARDEPKDVNHARLLAETLWDMAALQYRTGRLKEAGENLDRAVTIAERLEDAGDRDSTRQRTLGTALLERSAVHHRRGEFVQAEDAARRAVGLYDKLATAPPGEQQPVDRLLAVMATNRVAVVRRELGQRVEALELHTAAVARATAAAGPKPSGDAAYWLARTRLERADTAATEPARREAVAADVAEAVRLCEELRVNFPDAPLYREWLALGYLARASTAPATAAKDLDQARILLEALMRESNRTIPDYWNHLGRTCLALGKLSAAAGNAKDAAEWYRKAGIMAQGGAKLDPDNIAHRRLADEVDRARGPGKK